MRVAVVGLGPLLIGSAALAGQGNGARQAFRESQRERRRAHCQGQHQENRTFRQSIRGDEPCSQCSARADHRRTQFGENQSFREEQYTRVVAFVTARMQAKGASAEKQQRVLAFLASRHDQIMDFVEGRCEITVQLLERLDADSGLTREEMRAALRQRHEEAREQTQAFRQQLREDRPSRQGGQERQTHQSRQMRQTRESRQTRQSRR